VALVSDVEDGATDQQAAYRMTGEDYNVRVMWQFKLELRRMELDAQRMELERERQAEERKIELARIEADKEVRIAELRAQNDGNVEGSRSGPIGTDRAWEESLAGLTKRFGDALRHVLPQMPNESAELTLFFDSVEKLFKSYNVPADVQAKLVLPLLMPQAKMLIGRMPGAHIDVYDKIKQFLLA